MRASDIILGLGAVGLTAAVAKLIYDAAKPTASLPPTSDTAKGAAAGPIVDRGPASPIKTAEPTGPDGIPYYLADPNAVPYYLAADDSGAAPGATMNEEYQGPIALTRR